LVTLKLLVGVGFTVTRTVCGAEVQVALPGFATCNVKVLTPVLFQANVCGPLEVLGGVIQPPQFQLKVAPDWLVPRKFIVPELLTIEEEVHNKGVALNIGAGVGLTITVCVTVLAKHAVPPGLSTVSDKVLVPGVFQLIVNGPAVEESGVVKQPPQSQV
jgi:hypothetical protein